MNRSERQKNGIQINFRIEDGKIWIKNKKYGIRQLFVLAEIIKFLALTTVIIGILMLVEYRHMLGVFNIVVGVAVYGVGYMYGKIVRTAKQAIKNRRQFE